MEHKADLKIILEYKFREVVDKYLSVDTKKLFNEMQCSLDKHSHKGVRSPRLPPAAKRNLQNYTDLDQSGRMLGKLEHESRILQKSPRHRSIVNKDKKDRLYQDDLIDDYLAKYSRLVKQMAQDYKREAINLYITETFCEQEGKYPPSKNQALLEKAKCLLDPSIDIRPFRDKLVESTQGRV